MNLGAIDTCSRSFIEGHRQKRQKSTSEERLGVSADKRTGRVRMNKASVSRFCVIHLDSDLLNGSTAG
jgi:hypothetical protein